MLKNFLIARMILKFLLPYIGIYGIYIQLIGDYGPGGGFQAGVIFASLMIAKNLITEHVSTAKDSLKIKILLSLATLGVVIYLGTGIVCMLYGGYYLDYNVLSTSKTQGQVLGIFCVELGVGLTVSCAMYLIYLLTQAKLNG